jgi:hypothetical protein
MSAVPNLAAQRPGVRLRREALYLAYAGMEICWFTPFFLLMFPPARLHPPLAAGLVLGGVLLAFYAWSRIAERLQISLALERLVMLVALPVLILLGWRIYLHADRALLDVSWIPSAGYAMVAKGSGGYWVVMATVLFLWWRALALSRREFGFQSVAFAFRLDILLLTVGTLLLSLVVGYQVMTFIVPFFCFSLTAVALTRLEEVGQVRGDVGQLFDLYWLGVLGGSLLVVFLAGVGLTRLASPEGIDLMQRLWSPIGNALINAITWVLAILLAPFNPLLERLAALMAQGWQDLLSGPLGQLAQNLQGQIEVPEGSDIATQILAAVFTILRLVCGVGILVALIGAGLWVLNRERQRLAEQAETHEDLEAGLGAALASLLRSVGARLRSAAAMVSQFGIGSDLMAAISVRNIYINTCRLARKRGFPRHKARTAYEFLPDLQAAFPEATEEAVAITDAYVAVHYGELPTSREQMEELRAAYERLRQSSMPKNKDDLS